MVFLAQVSMVSPQYIPQEYQKQIINEMDSLLQATDYETIMQYEVKHWYVWATFLPYVKLAYVPNTQTEGPLQKLQLLSLEVIIFALQNMLGRENHREFLKKEGLLDFVTCMPQYVDPPFTEIQSYKAGANGCFFSRRPRGTSQIAELGESTTS